MSHELGRLGHHVTLHGNGVGGELGADLRGLRVARGEGELPTSCDAVVVQDAVCSYQLARRYPAAPQLFVAHSEYHDLQLPPQLPGIVGTSVAMNDRVAARLEALALTPRVVRLRQPVDRDMFFVPDRDLPEKPRRVLALGRRLGRSRAAALAEACARRGVEVEVTAQGAETDDVAERIAQADVVVGYGRCILEAMAMGRTAYVWDHLGGDGWVTAETYPALEADGFAGHGDPDPVDVGRFAEELDRFEPSMGRVNRDLVELHHGSARHAQRLVGLLRELEPAERTPGPFDELSRLTLLQWRMEGRELRLAREVEGLRQRLREANQSNRRPARRAARLWRRSVGGASGTRGRREAD